MNATVPVSEAARLMRWGNCEWRTADGRFRFDGFYVWVRARWPTPIGTRDSRQLVGEAEDVSRAQDLIDHYLDLLAANILTGKAPGHGGAL